jgi:hypothetical protein
MSYLVLMIRYARIGDQAWDSLSRSATGRLSSSRNSHDFRTAHESLEFHEYQLEQWEKGIPEELQFSHADHTDMKTTFLRTVLHLRANQMRIIMIRPFLYSSLSSTTHLGKCLTAMEVAGDTIQIIADLHVQSDMYRRQQALFNHFLVSALGLLYVLIIRYTVKEPLAPITDDRLSPDALAKAYGRLFRGLDILGSLGETNSTPRGLYKKLFSIISKLKITQSQNDYSERPLDCSSESSLRFLASRASNTSLQDRYHKSIIDPELTTTSSLALDIASNSIAQTFPEFCFDITNLVTPGEAYTEDGIYRDRGFGQHLITPGNEYTLTASFPEFQAAYLDSVRPGTMNWQNL